MEKMVKIPNGYQRIAMSRKALEIALSKFEERGVKLDEDMIRYSNELAEDLEFYALDRTSNTWIN